MHKTVFKVQSAETAKFWNGNAYYPMFNAVGEKWNRRSSLEKALTWYLSKLRKENPDAVIPSDWRIVEFEYIERVKRSDDLHNFLSATLIKSELHKLNWKFVSFYSEMETRGVAEAIEFIIQLKPDEGQRFISGENIKNARAQLRLLGVKTRTFREYFGMFGMMDRDQAMKARLTLDIQSMVDLSEIRRKVASDSNLENYISNDAALGYLTR